MAGERFDWERISQQIEAECGPGWNSHDFGGFEAVNSIDLFLRVLREPIDEASVAGLADTFGKSLWGALVENPYAASRILLWMHHAFSSKIHFCNTSNVLGSFLEGRPLAGGAGGHQKGSWLVVSWHSWQ